LCCDPIHSFILRQDFVRDPLLPSFSFLENGNQTELNIRNMRKDCQIWSKVSYLAVLSKFLAKFLAWSTSWRLLNHTEILSPSHTEMDERFPKKMYDQFKSKF
jgi:hypothetical protein